MAEWLRFPRVAPGVEEATVGRWRVTVGDVISRGDPVVELITDKATFDLEADVEGVVLRILAPEKTIAPVQYVLAVVGEPGETPADEAEAEAENRSVVERHQAKAASQSWAPPATRERGGAVRATPSARRLAKAEGVALDDVAASKGGGIVRDDDVKRFVAEGRR